MRSTPPGTTSLANRSKDTWPIASSAHVALCAALQTAQEPQHPWDSASCCGTDIARSGRLTAFCAGRNSQKMAATKQRHYPNIDRCEMFEMGYVAAKSGHSRGSTIDLTLYHLASSELTPMGGDHDLMDPVSHHGAAGITPRRSENRHCLRSVMEGSGFASYECEWWHYSLNDEPYPHTYFDFPIGTTRALFGSLNWQPIWAASWSGPIPASRERVSTRGRSGPGQLYVPIVAERDGHVFIPAARRSRRGGVPHGAGASRWDGHPCPRHRALPC